MKNLTMAQARARRRWMAVLFGLTVILLVLTPFYVILTVGGVYREMILLPELAAATMIIAVLLWPLFVVTEPVCLAATAALVFCGVVIAVELRRRQRYLEVTYQLKKSE